MKYTAHHVTGTQFAIVLDAWQNVLWFGRHTRDTRANAPAIRVRAAPPLVQQHLKDGVLFCDAQGVAAIIEGVHDSLARPTPLAVGRRMWAIFDGSANLTERCRAIVRICFGLPIPWGEEQFWAHEAMDGLTRATLADHLTANVASHH
ncbi:hypothetical protein [Novosphingobium sp. HII-3]|uniref:hypothetical protein n=1 Tax=Novosphingobium sp. HII-3 TaxID=2075565 RepID=UPI000CDB126E|nr:hypothetical protein [Novosphingobium sp. HII-3]